jgi:mono/diheme cytochrome c family protein
MKCTAVAVRADEAWFTGLSLSVFLILQLSACNLATDSWRAAGLVGMETTYEKFLAPAEAGEAESQNVVGVMLFHGEGAGVDRVGAEMWFWLAAEQGNERARRNLAFLHSMSSAALDQAPERDMDGAFLRGRLPGEALYAKFCAGCHGLNGIAAYVYSPSFALGQRLEKSDEALMRSLLNGKGEMPNWDDKLSRAELREVLRFIRTLRLQYDLGIGQSLRGAPALYYLFGPMRSDDRGISGPVR